MSSGARSGVRTRSQQMPGPVAPPDDNKEQGVEDAPDHEADSHSNQPQDRPDASETDEKYPSIYS